MRRLTWQATATFLAMLLGFGTVYYLPAIDTARRADAIVVLGVPGKRLNHGIALAQRGYAPVLVVSSPDPAIDPGRVPEVCRDASGLVPDHVEVICFTPDPFETRGEAQAVDVLARQRGWHSVLVVTYRSHISRARWYFQQCAPSVESYLVAYTRDANPGLLLERFVYETAGWLKAGVNHC